jgi:hypothetical protein
MILRIAVQPYLARLCSAAEGQDETDGWRRLSGPHESESGYSRRLQTISEGILYCSALVFSMHQFHKRVRETTAFQKLADFLA